MKKQHKLIFGLVAVITVAAACLLVDGFRDRTARKRAVLDAQYEEMIYAIVQGQAQEQSTNHPMQSI